MNWIKSSEQKPEIGKKVIAVNMNDKCPKLDFCAYFGDDDWTSYNQNAYHPTHWMDLPNLPGAENG